MPRAALPPSRPPSPPPSRPPSRPPSPPAAQPRAPSAAASDHRTAATTFVVYAKDKDRVAEFYRQVLALQVREWEDGFSVLAGAGIEISVIRMPVGLAAMVEITSPPQLREDTPLKPSFLVPSFEAVREAAEATGGGLKPAAAEWSWRGCAHLDGHDPEGNIVQFRRATG